MNYCLLVAGNPVESKGYTREESRASPAEFRSGKVEETVRNAITYNSSELDEARSAAICEYPS